MKTVKKWGFLLVFWASIAGATGVQQQHEAEEGRILKQMTEGKISQVEAMIEVEAAGRAFFPADNLLHARNASFIRYAQQAASGEISQEQLAELILQRMARFEEARSARTAAADAQAQANQQAQAEHMAAQQRGQFIGNMLRNLGIGMQRSAQPHVNCTSNELGGTVVTNCQ